MAIIHPFDFVLGVLATYRLALMVSSEAGPFWMFKHFRRLVKREAPKKAHMDDGIECMLCMSMQIAVVTAVTYDFFHGRKVFDLTVLALALSGAAIILHRAFTKDLKK